MIAQPGVGAEPTHVVGSVIDPSHAQVPDGSFVSIPQGRHSEVLTAQWRGKWGNAASRGTLFYASTVIAGASLPKNAATLASVWTLHNPAGSGKNES